MQAPFWTRFRGGQRRIDSASESAAADPALEAVPSADLIEKPLNEFAEKHFWQVCASTSTRYARAAAVREADLFVYDKTLYSFPSDFRIALDVAKGVLNRRFKRRFAYFAAGGKVGRPGGRNSPFPVRRPKYSFFRRHGKGTRAGARNTPLCAGARNILPFSQQSKEESPFGLSSF